jgi:hypothetical protein
MHVETFREGFLDVSRPTVSGREVSQPSLCCQQRGLQGGALRFQGFRQLDRNAINAVLD